MEDLQSYSLAGLMVLIQIGTLETKDAAYREIYRRGWTIDELLDRFVR